MIRRYQLTDIPEMIEILKKDLTDTTYKDVAFDYNKIMGVLVSNVENSLFFGNLMFEDDQMIGAMFATLSATIFSNELAAYDTIFYLIPEKRSLKRATALVENYISWAKERNVKKVVLSNSMGRDVEKFAQLAKLLGFTQVGTIHHMELK